jgi:DNA polymerase-1
MHNPHAEPHTLPQRLILVDGSGYIFRAYHALPPLTRPDGVAVGAVYGYTKMLLKLRERFAEDFLTVVFDASRISFRQDIYPDYKANRDETPEDLIPQFAIVRDATEAMGIPQIEVEGYEADDIIASYAKAAHAEGREVIIISSDKDLMQLVTEGISMHDPMKQRDIHEAQVIEKFGVPPERVTHVQALMGDSVDNVPGVPGIGPKTAAQLINEYGDLEGLLANLEHIKQPKRRESLQQNIDNARLSFALVTLKDDVPLPIPITELAPRSLNMKQFVPFLAAQHFTSMVKKYGGEDAVIPMAAAPEHAQKTVSAAPNITKEYTTLRDRTTLGRWVQEAMQLGVVAIDTETTSLHIHDAALVGISLCSVAGKAAYVPIGHVSEGAGQSSLFDAHTGNQKLEGQLSLAEVRDALAPLLTHAGTLKIGHNMKYDMSILANHGFAEIAPIADTMLMSYAAGAGLHAHGLDALAERIFGHRMIPFKEVVGTGKNQKTFAEIDLEKATEYAAEDADYTLRLYQHFVGALRHAHVTRVYETLERPLVPVIAAMEQAGITIDVSMLAALSDGFATQLQRLEKEIHVLAGTEFLVSSPKQLGEVLFDHMGIEGGKKSSKTGAYTTDAETLERLAAEGVEIAEKVLAWRRVAKLKSTYTDALPKARNAKTGRVHTSFSMASTSTGRLSSSDPNLQNIPIRTEEGREIRKAFIAADGCSLIGADYSQIELRLLAHIAEIGVLKEAFKHGKDIHAITASQMFGGAVDDVTAEQRRQAKTINFGIIYGISAHGLAARLGIARHEAAEYISMYFEQYPGIREYMDRTIAFARQHGYVETLFGRKMHVKDINAKNPNLRNFSERAAINAPLQGSAADIIKRAMIEVHHHLHASAKGARMLLQVHDELIVEAPTDIAASLAPQLVRLMQGAASLSIPLTVEANIGQNWGEIH